MIRHEVFILYLEWNFSRTVATFFRLLAIFSIDCVIAVYSGQVSLDSDTKGNTTMASRPRPTNRGKDDALLTALSIGVFVGTTLLSQWLQLNCKTSSRRYGENRPDDDEQSRWTSDNDLEEESSPKERYHRRQYRRRLSFHEVRKTDTLSSDEDDELAGSDISASTPDATFGDLPKNSNWNHFELYHRQKELSRDPVEETRMELEGSVAEDDEAMGDSEDVSLTSNDHFVWTHARYSPKSRGRRITPTCALPVVLSERYIEERLLTEQAKRSNGSSTEIVSYGSPESHNDKDSTLRQPKELQEDGLVPAPRIRSRTHSASDLNFSTLEPPQPLSNRSLSRQPSLMSNQIKQQNHAARANYNARIMPETVVMMRHGESMGNVNERLYATTPDNAMPLSELGWEQSRAAGKQLKEEVLDHPDRVHFIVSPYVRSVETFHGVVSAWCDPADFKHIEDRDQRLKAWYGRLLEMGLTWQEDPRIREQDFGNFQKPEQILRSKRERHEFGAFYYRFPHGESGSDVFDRISTFLDSLWRSFDQNKSSHYVLITHGIAIRVLLTRYFRYTIDQFHLLSNPRNCEMIVLEHDNQGRLGLGGRYELEWTEDEETHEKRILGYTKHTRLRVLPQDYIREVPVRISFND